MLVPQVGQTPLLAGLPFFIVIALALFISFLERHFTQYASIQLPLLKVIINSNKSVCNLFQCFNLNFTSALAYVNTYKHKIGV